MTEHHSARTSWATDPYLSYAARGIVAHILASDDLSILSSVPTVRAELVARGYLATNPDGTHRIARTDAPRDSCPRCAGRLTHQLAAMPINGMVGLYRCQECAHTWWTWWSCDAAAMEMDAS